VHEDVLEIIRIIIKGFVLKCDHPVNETKKI
jgi:hypothetical protein